MLGTLKHNRDKADPSLVPQLPTCDLDIDLTSNGLDIAVEIDCMFIVTASLCLFYILP